MVKDAICNKVKFLNVLTKVMGMCGGDSRRRAAKQVIFPLSVSQYHHQPWRSKSISDSNQFRINRHKDVDIAEGLVTYLIPGAED